MLRRLSTLAALASAGLLAASPACRSAPATPAPASAPDSPAPAGDATTPTEAAPAPEPDQSPPAVPAPEAPAAPHAHGHSPAGDPGHGQEPAQEHAHEHNQEHAHEHEQAKEDRHPHAHHRFDDAERYAKSFDSPARDRWQKPAEVVKLLALAPGHIVADLGAGTGYFLRHLAPAAQPGGRVLGLDLEPNMVAYMEKRIARERIPGAEARVVASTADPGLAAGSVDRVLVVNTWHHLDGRVEYARKLHQALRPGGFVLVVDYTMETRRGPPPAARLAPALVVDELTRAGFAAEVVEESLPEQYVVRGRKR
jgi:SAM-dependent methyltransferase